MAKKSNNRQLKAAVSLIFNILLSFIVIPTLIAFLVVVFLSGTFWPPFVGAQIGSALYRAFDREFKYNLKITWRWWLVMHCHNLEDSKKLNDGFDMDDWINQQEKPKEQTTKEKLNKSILDVD